MLLVANWTRGRSQLLTTARRIHRVAQIAPCLRHLADNAFSDK
jgi:hypothetical protein